MGDGSDLSAWSSSSFVYVHVSGTRTGITDVGEQLAWLGAALRSSPYKGIAYCTPHVTSDLCDDTEQEAPKSGSGQARARTLRIMFKTEDGSLYDDKQFEGKCWYNLFRNPILVRGFPVLKRPSPHRGLELSLDIIAALVGAVRAHMFNDVVFVKGFSAMLVPSERSKDLLVWHVFFNAGGSRISYLDSKLPRLQGVNLLNLQTSRHIVGWCGSAKSYAGTLPAQKQESHELNLNTCR